MESRRETSGRKQSYIFDPENKAPFKLSRNRLEVFEKCPRCFYLLTRLGIKPPESHPYTLNSAVDYLLKKEFDLYRGRRDASHPLLSRYGISAVPFYHSRLDEWRDPFRGMQHYYLPTHFVITGAPDDIWLVNGKELALVDYKSTSSLRDHSINSDYWISYKRQLEIYLWLLERQETGFPVSRQGYFILANARKDREGFLGRLDFDLELLSYQTDTDWIEPSLYRAYECIRSNRLPAPSASCEHCGYRKKAQGVEVE